MATKLCTVASLLYLVSSYYFILDIQRKSGKKYLIMSLKGNFRQLSFPL